MTKKVKCVEVVVTLVVPVRDKKAFKESVQDFYDDHDIDMVRCKIREGKKTTEDEPESSWV